MKEPGYSTHPNSTDPDKIDSPHPSKGEYSKYLLVSFHRCLQWKGVSLLYLSFIKHSSSVFKSPKGGIHKDSIGNLFRLSSSRYFLKFLLLFSYQHR